MDAILLIIVLVLLGLVALPIWALVSVTSLRNELRAWQTRVDALEAEIRGLRQDLQSKPTAAARAVTEPPANPSAGAATTAAVPAVTPTPAPALPPVAIPAVAAPARPLVSPAPATITRPTAHAAVAAPARAPAPHPRRPLNVEQFVGARLFAWLGGLAGFLAVGFFVKYSFEHDLISPEVRVAIGFLVAAGLIVAGLWIKADRLRVTSQVLCATGIVSLYSVTFACNAVYHFAFFTVVPTFALMALITATAFLLAVRKSAQVVALLGVLGGFLTPVLLKTGQDNPAGLFGYIALLDVGLIAVALHRRWSHLVPLAAVGTVALQIGWTHEFFAAPRAPLAMGISLGFTALFGLAAALSRRWERAAPAITWTAAGLGFVALGFAGWFISFPSISERAPLLFGFIFALDGLLLALAARDEQAVNLPAASGTAVFGLLAVWTGLRLTDALLPAALAAYLIFAVLHTAFPLVLARFRPGASTAASQFFPPLALVLMLVPLLKLGAVSSLFWPAVLVIDAIAVGLAVLTTSIVVLAAVLLLTLVATAASILHATILPGTATELLLVVGGFALFFFAASLFVARRLGGSARAASSGLGSSPSVFGAGPAQLAAFAGLLPFILLVLMSARLAFPSPAPLFGLAALLIVLLLGLTRLLALEWLPACALAGVTLLEYTWYGQHFRRPAAAPTLGWLLGFHAAFAAYPFVFRRQHAAQTGPWAIAALSGIAPFALVHQLVRTAWPNDVMGLLPTLFALPPLAALVPVLRLPATDPAKRLNQIAWYAGVALFFVTLIFPLQFERQWITIGWALEGVALVWLYQRVPHPGLRATGVVLLVIAFVRLALNPAVFGYHARSTVAIFNWYLYAYGLVTVALFAAGRLLRPTDDGNPVRVLGVPAAPLLHALGTVLGFLLLNVEIADYFGRPGTTLTFQFSGNFARDMAYTVGWALYALVVLGAGIWRRARPARLAAIGLLGVTLLKLFFHDLAQLGQLYRVGALVGVAAVAIIASFLYQRFVSADDDESSRG